MGNDWSCEEHIKDTASSSRALPSCAVPLVMRCVVLGQRGAPPGASSGSATGPEVPAVPTDSLANSGCSRRHPHLLASRAALGICASWPGPCGGPAVASRRQAAPLPSSLARLPAVCLQGPPGMGPNRAEMPSDCQAHPAR